MDNVTRLLMQGAAGASGKTTYVDDVFSTYVYRGKGDNTTNSVTNNVDLTEGGMVWTKGRDIAYSHIIYDSLRGQNYLTPNADYAQATDSRSNIAFNSTGYTFGDASTTSWGPLNEGGYDFASWTFRKSKGFFDIVTWTGNATANRQISHNLGCVPGCILIKQTSGAAENWAVYHRGIGSTKALKLNKNFAADTGIEYFQNTDPTATNFTIGIQPPVNGNGNDYIAYLFAGGESTADTARSVDFSDQNYLLCSDSSLATGTGLFTLECWVKLKDTSQTHYILDTRTNDATSDGFGLYIDSGLQPKAWNNGGQGSFFTGGGQKVAVGVWSHIAVVRDATNSLKLYVNGVQSGTTYTGTQNWSAGRLGIGLEGATTSQTKGYMSNVRLTVGQALYTSSFRPTTEPLTTTSQGATASNVKVLCCNNSSVTGGTAGTITPSAYGNGGGSASGPAASTDSPFDDPEGFKFGEEGDQNIIKCGSYKGSGTGTGPEINLGFEPDFLIVKNATSANSWFMFDNMRGIVSGGNDFELYADTTSTEVTLDRLSLTSTGFKLKDGEAGGLNTNDTHVYIAIRRSDGYVGKPAEAGTDVFAMDTGSSSSTIPTFDSYFVADYALQKKYAANQYWQSISRLTGTGNMETNQSRIEEWYSGYVWDSNVGINKHFDSTDQAWMWKRGAGFDVVAYEGNSTAGHQISHNLNKIPEMIWVKNRDATRSWRVYHKGLNGGTNPQNYYLVLNNTALEDTDTTQWNDTAPTSTTFSVGTSDDVNNNSMIAFLFASVDGISKVGSYDGTDTTQTITTGFSPRFVILKRVNTTGSWFVLDTTRGWSSGNDNFLLLNSSAAQDGNYNLGEPTATGFTLTGNDSYNNAGDKFIYYAHA